jgi:peptidoglycan/xylan/chitin deacetylase (PgdA/CDA1 family)
MRGWNLISMAAALSLAVGPAAAAQCEDPEGGLGVSRIIEIDTANGPLYGDMSRYAREESFLGPKEVVLTFDDGPMPSITKPILDTLDKFCTKATFFSVGRMAIAYPAMTKEIMARGHTLGTHTWSHPLNLKRSGLDRARDEIERGFSAVAMAAGQPIAPFFRFPGLSDSDPMLAHLQSRGIAAFTVDVVSNDSFISDPGRLTERTIAHTVARDGGILLFHDIKRTTATALPEILRQLKERGFKVVHMRAKTGYAPVADYDAQLASLLAKSVRPRKTDGGKPALIPFTATVTPEIAAAVDATQPDAPPPGITTAAIGAELPVTALAPEARVRSSAGQGDRRKRQQVATSDETATEPQAPKPKTWSTRTKKQRPPKPEGEKRFFD